MVAEKGDIPDADEVAPEDTRKGELLGEMLDRGETIVHLRDGTTEELHGYDTHVFEKPQSSRPGIVYTQNADDEEVWFSIEEIVRFVQH